MNKKHIAAVKPSGKVVGAADRPHNFQRCNNLQKRKESGGKKGVVVIKREKSWTTMGN